jgi:hypothetical protein
MKKIRFIIIVLLTVLQNSLMQSQNPIASDSILNNQKSDSIKIKSTVNTLDPLQKEGFKIWDYLSNFLSSLVGVGIPILVFYLESKRERKKEDEKEKKETNEKFQYLSSLIDSSIKISSKQNEFLKKYLDGIKSNPLNSDEIKLIPRQNLNRLSKLIDNPEYYHAFLNSRESDLDKIKRFKDITSSVDFLNSQFIQLDSILEKNLKNNYERNVRYQTLVNDSMDLVVEHNMNIESKLPDLSSSIGKIYTDYRTEENDSTDFKYHQDKFIEPLKIEFVKYIANPETKDVLAILKDTTWTYYDIIRQRQKHAIDYNSIYENCKKAIETLEFQAQEMLITNVTVHKISRI